MNKFLLATILSLSLFSIPAAADEEISCEIMTEVAETLRKDFPKQVDEVTTVVEVTADCKTKVLKYVKNLSLSKDSLEKGLEKRKQQQHTALHCKADGLARKGWNVKDDIYDSKKNLVMALSTSTKDCK